MNGEHVDRVRIRNVACFLAAEALEVDVPGLGAISFDVAYGGNFHAIIEAQENMRDMADLTPGEIQRLSPVVRDLINARYDFVHPEQPLINGVSHIMWTGAPTGQGADGRNAGVLWRQGDRPLAVWHRDIGKAGATSCQGLLKLGDDYRHESIIGSIFDGRIEAETSVGDKPAIIPSIAGWARIHGLNTIFVDDRDPLKHGFVLK